MYLYRLNVELDKIDINADVAKEYRVSQTKDNRIYRPVRKNKTHLKNKDI